MSCRPFTTKVSRCLPRSRTVVYVTKDSCNHLSGFIRSQDTEDLRDHCVSLHRENIEIVVRYVNPYTRYIRSQIFIKVKKFGKPSMDADVGLIWFLNKVMSNKRKVYLFISLPVFMIFRMFYY